MNPSTTAHGPHFAQTEIGPLEAWGAYHCRLPALSDRDIPGKFFLAEALGLQGMEISVNVMPPGVSMPFYHRHRRHEETYIVLSGRGQMQIDEALVELVPGSVVAIQPAGERIWRNTGTVPMHYLVIQAVSAAQCAQAIADGVHTGRPVCWPPT